VQLHRLPVRTWPRTCSPITGSAAASAFTARRIASPTVILARSPESENERVLPPSPVAAAISPARLVVVRGSTCTGAAHDLSRSVGRPLAAGR